MFIIVGVELIIVFLSGGAAVQLNVKCAIMFSLQRVCGVKIHKNKNIIYLQNVISNVPARKDHPDFWPRAKKSCIIYGRRLCYRVNESLNILKTEMKGLIIE